MYNIIKEIISHSWDTQNYNTTEQQIIYYICGCCIIIFSVVFIDLCYRIFSHFWKSKR
jgi:hypothetical protein